MISKFCSLGTGVLLGSIVFCASSPATGREAEASSRIDTETSVGLVSSLAHIEFSKTTGELADIKFIGDQAQLLNASADKGNPFRIYYGVKALDDRATGGGVY